MKTRPLASLAGLTLALGCLLARPGFAVEIEGPGDPLSAAKAPQAVPALPAQQILPALETAPVGPVPAAAQTSAAPVAQAEARASARQEIIKALAPENAQRVSDDQAKILSGQLLEGG